MTTIEKKVFFPGNTYQTPTIERSSIARFLNENSFAYNLNYLKIVIRCRRMANHGIYDDIAWEKSSWDILKNLENSGAKFDIKGMDFITEESNPVVFVSNHMSSLETMVFPVLISPRKKVTFVVKDNLVTNPIFGPIMRSRNPVLVGRKSSREDLKTVMTQGKERLEKGISVIIFPQSTRTVDFDPEKFNTMGVKLASMVGVKVVPMAIKTDCWANGKILKDIGAIHPEKKVFIEFHKPITITGTGKDEHKYIVDFIQSRLKEWNKA